MTQDARQYLGRLLDAMRAQQRHDRGSDLEALWLVVTGAVDSLANCGLLTAKEAQEWLVQFAETARRPPLVERQHAPMQPTVGGLVAVVPVLAVLDQVRVRWIEVHERALVVRWDSREPAPNELPPVIDCMAGDSRLPYVTTVTVKPMPGLVLNLSCFAMEMPPPAEVRLRAGSSELAVPLPSSRNVSD